MQIPFNDLSRELPLERSTYLDNLDFDPALGTPPLFYGEGHILICAEVRVKYQEKILAPNLMNDLGSALIMDEGGVLATMTAARRGPGNEYCEGMGQNVRVLDPERIADVPDELRACINPLDWLKADDLRCIMKASILSSALIPENPNASEPYWTDVAREFLACLLVHVATDDRIVAERRNLRTVYEFMMVGDFEVLFASMQNSPVFLDYISTYGSNLEMLFANSKNEWLGILSVAKQSLSWLMDPLMQAAMKKSDVDFNEMLSNPTGASVYVVSSSMDHYHGFYRMIEAMFWHCIRKTPSSANKHRRLLISDIMHHPSDGSFLLEMMDKSDEYDLRVCLTCQSLRQLQKYYPREWELILAGFNIRWFFNNHDQRTCDFIDSFLKKKR